MRPSLRLAIFAAIFVSSSVNFKAQDALGFATVTGTQGPTNWSASCSVLLDSTQPLMVVPTWWQYGLDFVCYEAVNGCPIHYSNANNLGGSSTVPLTGACYFQQISPGIGGSGRTLNVPTASYYVVPGDATAHIGAQVWALIQNSTVQTPSCYEQGGNSYCWLPMAPQTAAQMGQCPYSYGTNTCCQTQ